MKRWVVCKTELIAGMLEPAVGRFTNNFRCWSARSPQAGDWQLCQIGVADLTAINADSQCIVLPDLTLDATWGSLPANVRNIAINRLGDYGVDTSQIKASSTIRQVLMLIGRQHQPTMDPERGDVADF